MASRSRQKRAIGAAPRPKAPDAEVDYRGILESMGDIVYTLDLQGHFTYFNTRAYEVLGYDRVEGARFIGREFVEILAPTGAAAAVNAIRVRVEFPRDRQIFRFEARHKSGRPILLEVHGGPLLRAGRIVGRMGVGRVLEDAARQDGAMAGVAGPQALQEERMRIARGLRDALTQVVFGVTADREASESFLVDIKRSTLDDMARRLDLDDVDLAILRQIAAGASNREIGVEVHLSPAAIKDRIRRIMNRLGARRRAELAAHALRLGIA